MITTINGNISTVGVTYIHEHLKIDLSTHKKDPDTNFDDIESVIAGLKDLKKIGLDTIVDVTNRGMGRDIQAMLQVSKETGLNIIASTGFYKEPYLPEYVYQKSDKELEQLLIKDITIGIDNTSSKAHILGEVGTSLNTVTPIEKRLFKIISKVHYETGKPIFTHTTLGTMAFEQIRIFKDMKMDLEKVLIGHMDLATDMDYILTIADQGCYLGFDTIGKLNYQTDNTRIRLIKELLERGFDKQIVLSLDITRKSHLRENGGIGYDYIIKQFIPKLKEQGISQQTIDRFLIHNPNELLNSK